MTSKSNLFGRSGILVWIEITQLRQLKCRYCYNAWRSNPSHTHKEMSPNTVDLMIDFCRNLATEHNIEFAIAGGDPTAHSEYVSITSKLATIAPVTIVSHGCHFRVNDLETISRINGAQIQYSIPSLDEQQFYFMTGGNSLKSVLSNLANSVALGIPSTISSVLSRPSLATNHATQVIRLAQSAGISRIIFNKFLPAGRGFFYNDEFALGDDDFLQHINQARQTVSAFDIEIYVSEPIGNVRQRKIVNPKITICYDGAVRHCSMARSAIGTIIDSPSDVLEKCHQFWQMGGVDVGCICSRHNASLNHLNTLEKEAIPV